MFSSQDRQLTPVAYKQDGTAHLWCKILTVDVLRRLYDPLDVSLVRLPLERQVIGVVGALVDDDGVEVVDRRQERSVARRDAAEQYKQQ